MPLLGGSSSLEIQGKHLEENCSEQKGLASTETLRQDHTTYTQEMATVLIEPENVQGNVVRNETGEEVGEIILFGYTDYHKD